ncbi:hypothetical protein RchiOBHm_Chr6g0283761 [Rosa chinensis]|uniref:Uncharacterized protein n=1 Tax=Rosa chinensis TaxID=74649 RepID=A0A2P6PU44_ROSCH|nr:hypothetical protein RchiOBHm_Chr6g0283761 [Rosa chinensis]
MTCIHVEDPWIVQTRKSDRQIDILEPILFFANRPGYFVGSIGVVVELARFVGDFGRVRWRCRGLRPVLQLALLVPVGWKAVE